MARPPTAINGCSAKTRSYKCAISPPQIQYLVKTLLFHSEQSARPESAGLYKPTYQRHLRTHTKSVARLARS